MAHAKGMCAITNPLVNSYKRINTGFDAPKEISWTQKNENALLRLHTRLGEDTKVEIRFPDSAANPYLATAVCIAAGLDGIEKHISAGKTYRELKEEGTVISRLPETLREAINEIKKDTLMEETLGKEFLSVYTDAKKVEWKEYLEEVTDWEVRKYLNRV